jgi:hypothetical protein
MDVDIDRTTLRQKTEWTADVVPMKKHEERAFRALPGRVGDRKGI